MSESFFSSSEFKNKNLDQPDYDVIKGVSNNTLPIMGKISLPIEIDHKIFWKPVHIVKGLNQSVITGIDFMERHNVSLNLRSKTIQIAESNISIPLETKMHFARSANKTVIPPKHEIILPIRISRLKHNQTVCLDPVENNGQ